MTNQNQRLTRREFLVRTGVAGAVVAAMPMSNGLCAESSKPRMVVFSKIYQTLKLNFEESAELTAEAGLHGVDCALRPGGEIEPERVRDDLPRYLEALRKRGLGMPMIASGITGPETPHAETVLREISKAGIQLYRIAPIKPEKDEAARRKQIVEFRARLADLAKLNRELKLTAVVQNHSPRAGYLGGSGDELADILDGFDPQQVGAAFDLGHAIVVHGNDWRKVYERIQKQQRLAYVKDVTAAGKWVPFGEGEFSRTDYFPLLRKNGYAAPYSIHIEFDWDQGGKARNKGVLLSALKQSREVLSQWLAKA